jgi:hypothetical protein
VQLVAPSDTWGVVLQTLLMAMDALDTSSVVTCLCVTTSFSTLGNLGHPSGLRKSYNFRVTQCDTPKGGILPQKGHLGNTCISQQRS